MPSNVFRTKKGKSTDIMHSYGYYKAPYKVRRAMAFNKPFLNSLSERDRYLMRGYAQAKVEEVQAFKYKHPSYVRVSNRTTVPHSEISKYFR